MSDEEFSDMEIKDIRESISKAEKKIPKEIVEILREICDYLSSREVYIEIESQDVAENFC